MSNSVALLIARILLSLLFLMGGLEKFSAIEGTAGYIAAYGFPASTLLAWLAAIFETVAGIAILIGFQTRLAAYALTGGVRSFHGRACSSCAASRNNVASSPNRAVNIMPSGSPAAFHASGIDIDGWPDMLNIEVPGI